MEQNANTAPRGSLHDQMYQNLCNNLRCGKKAEVEGFCMTHRFGTCETPGCGKIAIARIALSEIKEGADGRSVTRFMGAPLACEECCDPETRAKKVLVATTPAKAPKPAKFQPGDELH